MLIKDFIKILKNQKIENLNLVQIHTEDDEQPIVLEVEATDKNTSKNTIIRMDLNSGEVYVVYHLDEPFC